MNESRLQTQRETQSAGGKQTTGLIHNFYLFKKKKISVLVCSIYSVYASCALHMITFV